jgi:peptidoglycan hydrolase-like protein with peptidoglycan-binding domain
MIKVRRLIENGVQWPVSGTNRDAANTSAGSEIHLEPHPVRYEINPSSDTVCRLQLALWNEGHDPGAIDGVAGHRTMAALTAYQKANSMTSGLLTIESLRRLQVF